MTITTSLLSATTSHDNPDDVGMPVWNMPTARPVLVTPDVAAEWLTANHVNRNRRQHTIERYARDMRAGQWAYTGDPIKFSAGGALLDGQHRLAAIILANVDVVLPVIHGLPEQAQKFMDSGDRRTASDTLSMAGHPKPVLLAATAKMALSIRHADLGNSATVSTLAIESWVNEHPEVATAVEIAHRYRRLVMCQPAIMAFASWHIWNACDDWNAIDDFWNAAAYKVGLRRGDPVLLLTNRFAKDRAARVSHPRRVLVAAIVRCWNARRAGKSMTLLRYDTNTDGTTTIPDAAK